MRTRPTWLFGLLVAVGAAGAAPAADRDKALEIIDRAVQAHGGETALARAKMRLRTAEGVQFPQREKVPFQTELTLALPDRLRDVIEVGGPQKVRITQVMNKDQAWRVIAGTTQEVGPEELDNLREEVYLIRLTTLLPLKEKGFELSTLPEVRLAGKPASVVRVVSPGHREVKLYFDQATGLLVKAERRAREAGLALRKEYLFSDFKPFDGVMVATRHVELLDRTPYLELKITSCRFPSQLDDQLFRKP